MTTARRPNATVVEACALPVTRRTDLVPHVTAGGRSFRKGIGYRADVLTVVGLDTVQFVMTIFPT